MKTQLVLQVEKAQTHEHGNISLMLPNYISRGRQGVCMKIR